MRRALLVLLPLCLFSCTPAPVLQLTALHPGSTWVAGRMASAVVADSLEWHVMFEGTEQDELVFAVDVWNDSRRRRLVDPAAFWCTIACTGRKLPRTLAGPIPALDPEAVLRNISIQESNVLAAHRTAVAFAGIGLVLELADDIVNAAQRTDEEQRNIDLDRAERADQRNRDAYERGDRLDQLAWAREALATSALRRTELFPGDSVSGRVRFAADAFAAIPAPPPADDMRLPPWVRERPEKAVGWFLLLHFTDGANESVLLYALKRESSDALRSR